VGSLTLHPEPIHLGALRLAAADLNWGRYSLSLPLGYRNELGTSLLATEPIFERAGVQSGQLVAASAAEEN
jgi:hypothetical protein